MKSTGVVHLTEVNLREFWLLLHYWHPINIPDRQMVYSPPTATNDNVFRISELKSEDDCLLLDGTSLLRLDLRVSKQIVHPRKFLIVFRHKAVLQSSTEFIPRLQF